MRFTRWLIVACLMSLALGAASSSRAQVLDPIQYQLLPSSHLEFGCFGPCACPVLASGPLSGDFTFYRTGVDPLFTHYALLNIAWRYTIGGGPSGTPHVVHVTGHGTYDLGGEFALMQRMTLDVTSDGTLEQHFDSGLVPVRAVFPVIDIDVSLHLMNACIDSVIRVLASPFGVASVEPSPVGRLIKNALPNPTERQIDVVLGLANPGHARVDVLDLGGRLIARLVDRDLAAGEYHLRWDGRNSSGVDAGAGVFWIRAQAGDLTDQRRIVRLR